MPLLLTLSDAEGESDTRNSRRSPLNVDVYCEKTAESVKARGVAISCQALTEKGFSNFSDFWQSTLEIECLEKQESIRAIFGEQNNKYP
jgi:hypothetical protein